MKLNPFDIGFYIVFGLVAFLFFGVVQPYLALFLLAFCTAVTIMPAYQWVQSYLKLSSLSAIVTAGLFFGGSSHTTSHLCSDRS